MLCMRKSTHQSTKGIVFRECRELTVSFQWMRTRRENVVVADTLVFPNHQVRNLTSQSIAKWLTPVRLAQVFFTERVLKLDRQNKTIEFMYKSASDKSQCHVKDGISRYIHIRKFKSRATTIGRSTRPQCILRMACYEAGAKQSSPLHLAGAHMNVRKVLLPKTHLPPKEQKRPRMVLGHRPSKVDKVSSSNVPLRTHSGVNRALAVNK